MFLRFGVLLNVLLFTYSYKILLYNPKWAHSHSHFIGRIADVLAEEGHNVTVLVSEIDPDVADGTKLSKIIRISPNAEAATYWKRIIKSVTFESNGYSLKGAYSQGKVLSFVYATQCRALLEEPGLVDKLKVANYDVYFTEHIDMCGVGLIEVIKPRSFISLASTNIMDLLLDEFGIPSALSYDPAAYVSKMNVHSIWDRAVNMYRDFQTRLTHSQIRSAIHDLYKEKYGLNFPTLNQISSNSAYIFANNEPLINFARPTIRKVIYINGIGATEPKKLSNEWEKVLSQHETNVLIAFGSMLQSSNLPLAMKHSIVETVKALPNVTFIWKYEEDDDFTINIASKVSNLKLTKWMPQVDLLAHPNMSLFITHGGMVSVQETALRGKPAIFIPICSEQPRNSGMMAYNGLGKVFDRSELSNWTRLTAVIKEVLENESYRNNARRVSAMLRKRPFSAREQVVKYTEFAAEFGPSEALRPQSFDMNWIEYHNVDILITGTFFASSFFLLALKLIQMLSNRLKSKKILKHD